MIAFLLWLLLLVLCWPLALAALVLYPIVWLLLLPLRLVGVVVEGVFVLLRALILLPVRALGARRCGTHGARCAAARVSRAALVRERLHVRHERRTTALEPVEAAGGIAQCRQIRHLSVVQPAAGIGRGAPPARHTRVARRDFAAQGDELQGVRLHRPHHARKRSVTTVQPSQFGRLGPRFLTRPSRRGAC